MHFKSFSKCIIVGIAVVTIMNTVVLFSCKFSDAGCPLSSNYKDTSKHLPVPSGEFKQTIYYRNGKQLNENDEQFLNLESQIKSGQQKKVPEENDNNLQRDDNEHKELKKREKTTEKVLKKIAVIKSNKEEENVISRETIEQNNDEKKVGEPMEVSDYKDVNHNSFKPEDCIIAGNSARKEAFLVIGVPSVKRSKANYLIQTLQDLVSGLEESEKQEVLILVFATDFDPTMVLSIVEEVSGKFPKELESGLIRVIKAPHSFYPNLNKLPLLYGDSPERVKWRSKQCLDYAFLFRYAKDFGQYYLQIEDDVSTVNGYLKKIKGFVTKHDKRKWSILEFGARGFIGMLYRCTDLKKLSIFVKHYYWVAPIDLLFRHFNEFHLYANPQWAKLVNPPLFRHVGAFSSLDGQVRKLEDVKGSGRRIYKDSDNPPAKVTTSITMSIRHSKIKSAYDKLYHGTYWGRNIKKADEIIIHFDKTTKVVKFIVESGGANAPEDYFGGAKVYYATENEDGECEDYYLWKDFLDSPQLKIISKDPKGMICDCIKIEISKLRRDRKGSVRWLFIREIAVWAL